MEHCGYWSVWRLRAHNHASLRLPLRGRDEELDLHGIRRREFSAYPKLFPEPLQCFGSLDCPDHTDVLGYRFSVTHALDEVMELRYDSGDTTSASNHDDIVE